MKMYYGNTPINSLNIKHYEMDTNSATVKPSDLQAGVTCFGRGQKIIGTGKSFEFANYGKMETNTSFYVPDEINVIEIASLEYPIQSIIPFSSMGNIDFSTIQAIGKVNIDGSDIEITAKVENNLLTLSCLNTISLQVFYGRDNYL